MQEANRNTMASFKRETKGRSHRFGAKRERRSVKRNREQEMDVMILSVVAIIGEEIAYNQQKGDCFLRISFTTPTPSQQPYPRDDVSKQLCLLATTSRYSSFILLFSNPQSSSIKESTFNPDLSRLNTFFPLSLFFHRFSLFLSIS